MIIEWLYSLVPGLEDWFLGLFGPADIPDWLGNVSDFLASMINSAAGLGAWVPWAFVIGVSGTLLGVWLIGLLIRVVRWLIGLIPTMGGGS